MILFNYYNFNKSLRTDYLKLSSYNIKKSVT